MKDHTILWSMILIIIVLSYNYIRVPVENCTVKRYFLRLFREITQIKI